mmetsp:Transcript_11450/g.33001  ORF Transcript_11450/g.33001 Transcript_11450/m.33001 type:complete len:247 (-) Transcript_11450:370-1110(-)
MRIATGSRPALSAALRNEIFDTRMGVGAERRSTLWPRARKLWSNHLPFEEIAFSGPSYGGFCPSGFVASKRFKSTSASPQPSRSSPNCVAAVHPDRVANTVSRNCRTNKNVGAPPLAVAPASSAAGRRAVAAASASKGVDCGSSASAAGGDGVVAPGALPILSSMGELAETSKSEASAWPAAAAGGGSFCHGSFPNKENGDGKSLNRHFLGVATAGASSCGADHEGKRTNRGGDAPAPAESPRARL